MTTYPSGYGTTELSLDALIARHHGDKMHPEFRRRLRAWLESHGGLLGIGDGYRVTQPVKVGFAAPGKSFHQAQRFQSGITAYSAVDLVCRQPGSTHSSGAIPLKWVPLQGSAEARRWGLHINVGVPNVKGFEVWHIQCIEMDGYDTWVNGGRRDPKANYPLPTAPLPVDPPVPPSPAKPPVNPSKEDNDMPWFLAQWHDGSWWWIRWDKKARMGHPNDRMNVGVPAEEALRCIASGTPTFHVDDAELPNIPAP